MNPAIHDPFQWKKGNHPILPAGGFYNNLNLADNQSLATVALNENRILIQPDWIQNRFGITPLLPLGLHQ